MNIEPISLSKFLSRYANVTGYNLKKITHEEVKLLFPELVSTSFKELRSKMRENNEEKNISELFLSGKVILVTDGRHTIPYYTPTLSEEYEEEMQFEREDCEIEVDDRVYDYTSLNEYELRRLLRRKFNSYRNQVCARKELEVRGIEITKKYRRSDYKKDYYEED